jgi:hypothetical protein
MVINLIFQPIFVNISGWSAMRQFASIMAGPAQLTPATFNFGLLILDFVFVCFMAAIYTAFSVALVRPTSLQTSLIGGLVLGLAFYVVNYYMWSGLFPWLADARNWVTFVDHLIAGFLAGLVYITVRREVSERELRTREVPIR